MTNKILPEYTKRSCNTVAGTIDDSKTWNLDLRKLRNLGEGNWKVQTARYCPVFSLKFQFNSYLVENGKKKKVKHLLQTKIFSET